MMRTIGNLSVYESPDSPKWTFAESTTCVRTYNGPYTDLMGALPPRGQPMEGTGSGMLVQTYQLSKQKGGRAVLTVNLIGYGPAQTPSSPDAPLKVTAEIDWVGVQKDLRTNPIFNPDDPNNSGQGAIIDISPEGWAKLERWENEQDSTLKGAFKFKDVNGAEQELSEDEVQVARKILKGVKGYTLYAPIMRKTSIYKEQPVPERCGFIQAPQVDVIVPVRADGVAFAWLKTACRDLQQQNGTWQRVEEWTGADEVDEDLYPAAPGDRNAPGSDQQLKTTRRNRKVTAKRS
jgi:hypothetical protein